MPTGARKFVIICGVAIVVVVPIITAIIRYSASPGTIQKPSQSPVCEKIGETRWKIARLLRDKYLRDSARITEDIHLKPTAGSDPDSITELRIAKLAKDSPMYMAGFRVNDRILNVNNTAVKTLSRAFNLSHEIQLSSRLNVQVEREGKLIDYQFDFE